jgi:hypothetical protein
MVDAVGRTVGGERGIEEFAATVEAQMKNRLVVKIHSMRSPSGECSRRLVFGFEQNASAISRVVIDNSEEISMAAKGRRCYGTDKVKVDQVQASIGLRGMRMMRCCTEFATDTMRT